MVSFAAVLANGRSVFYHELSESIAPGGMPTGAVSFPRPPVEGTSGPEKFSGRLRTIRTRRS
jgi:hypothetical protein